ncbi:MAG: helix-hairpin-helix domain-containing protein [Tepidanaerobacteraceae bacterium]|jgi:competence protein ComEA|nr:helix-hairpin-helix domain-containing protein [Tepidanaerobacteraceae bacterium]
MFNLSSREKILLGFVLAIAIISGGLVYYAFYERNDNVAFRLQEAPAIPVTAPASQEQPKKVVVYVTGAVRNPGVYTLEDGMRVKDAIDLAGGPLPEADLLRINLAQKLHDEDKLYIPEIGEIMGESTLQQNSAGIASSGDGKININTAGLSELDALPGIGPATAQKIIDYRTQNGPFKSIDDIKNVSGIGDKKFEQLKDKIKVN